jgi:cyanophycinase
MMKIPKGKLIPIGGNEAKDIVEDQEDQQMKVNSRKSILKEIIHEMRVKKPLIEIIPAASNHQEEIGENYRKAFKKLGLEINVMIINDKKNTDDETNLERIANADGIFFTGGDQLKLRDTLHGSKLLELIRKKYINEDFVIAGTSAGAMIMSELMINTGESQESVLKGIVRLTEGFDFLPGTIIDTHFFNRGRFARLTEALLQKHKLTGFGISEDSGLVVNEGNLLRAIGSGTVLIIDNHEIKSTNYAKIKSREPVFVENLVVHILAPGSAYKLKEKEFVIAEF